MYDTAILSSIGCLSSPVVFSHDNNSAAWFLVQTRCATLNSNPDERSRRGASLPVEFAGLKSFSSLEVVVWQKCSNTLAKLSRPVDTYVWSVPLNKCDQYLIGL